jgi:Zn-dependent peptidase ImmA (M78 family)
VFRRKLENSNISGLYIKHPIAGKCVLINYNEDIYRQRFTAAHEVAHTILDENDDVLVSFSWDKKDLKEIRANTFASAYLMPPEFICKIPESNKWTVEKSIEWANKLKVSTHALAIALSENNLIDNEAYKIITGTKVPKSYKEDPELSSKLPPNSRERKQVMLEHGLSDYYVALCFEAYRERILSESRLTEMLLLETNLELYEFSKLYGESI